MRKKSHISLAKFIAENSDDEALKKHRFSFYLGSILPDIKPSFLYKKHEINGTIPNLQYQMCRLMDRMEEKQEHSRKSVRKMGEMSHYLADYFTFPHNKEYPGSLKDHCSYEEELKQDLRSYLKTHEAKTNLNPKKSFGSVDALFDFVKKSHKDYLDNDHSVKHDIEHIVEVNHQAMEGFVELLKNHGQHKNYINQSHHVHHGGAA